MKDQSADAQRNHEFLELDGDSTATFANAHGEPVTGDRRDGLVYRYRSDVKFAVRIAVAVERPLLVLGPSGCGKSSLAFSLARVLGRRFYEFVVDAQTEATDLLYRFDAIRRLGDAHLAQVAGSDSVGASWRSIHPFIEPGPLWWVIDHASAPRRGAPSAPPGTAAVDPGIWLEGRRPGDGSVVPGAVLLIDEIDKGDNDLTNSLLVPLGSQQFVIRETGDRIGASTEAAAQTKPLVVITSNGERQLPEAFVRRCVILTLQPPTVDELVSIGRSTFPSRARQGDADLHEIAVCLQSAVGPKRLNAAEYLDTVCAIDQLNVPKALWTKIIGHTTWSSEREDD